MSVIKNIKDQVPFILCNVDNECYNEIIMLFVKNNIKFNLLSITEDVGTYPYLSYNNMEWFGMEGLKKFIEYYNIHG